MPRTVRIPSGHSPVRLTVPSRTAAPFGREGLAENRSRCEHRRTMARARSDSPPLFEIIERPDFSVESEGDGRGPVAGRRPGRSRARPACRTGGGGGGDPRSRKNPRRPRRFEAADRRAARGSVRDHSRQRARRLDVVDLRRRHRRDQHPARQPGGDAPRRCRPAACSRSWRWPTAATSRPACPVPAAR